MATTNLSREYKDFTIYYSESTDKWAVNETTIEAATLKAAKAAIDELERSARRMTPIAIITTHSSGYARITGLKIREGIITMLAPKEKYQNERKVWVRWAGDKRADKTYIGKGYALDTPENRASCQRIIEAARKVEAAEQALEKLRDELPRIDLDALLEAKVPA